MSTERLYDTKPDRASNNVPQGLFSFGIGEDGRPLGFPQQYQHAGLPAPFATVAVPDGVMARRGDTYEALPPVRRGGGDELSEHERRELLARARSSSADPGDNAYGYGHHHRQQDRLMDSTRSTAVGAGGEGGGEPRGFSFEGRFSSGHAGSSNGPSLPRFGFDRHFIGQEQAGSTESGRRGSPEVGGFHRPAWQGPEGPYAPSAPAMLGNYHGGANGSAGGVAAAGVRAQEAWAPQRSFEGERRVVN